MRLLHFTVLILSYACSPSCEATNCMESPHSECLNTKRIDRLEHLMSEQIMNIKELLKMFSKNQEQIVDIRHNMKQRFDHLEKALDQLVDGSNHSIMMIPTNLTQSCSASTALNGTGVLVNPAAIARGTGPIKSCRDLPYTDQALLQLRDQYPPFWVLCVHKGAGSEWVVIQQRVFGKVDFFRSWMEYRDGFGSLDSEFWLGLENIHRITRLQQHELLVEITDFQGTYKYAQYSRFEIGGEDEGYALRHLGSYSGTAGDSLEPHVGMKFSTYDNDNDQHESKNCALTYSSGWWFHDCFKSNLNGLAVKSEDWFSINWYGFSDKWQSLKYTRMMLRVMN